MNFVNGFLRMIKMDKVRKKERERVVIMYYIYVWNSLKKSLNYKSICFYSFEDKKFKIEFK